MVTVLVRNPQVIQAQAMLLQICLHTCGLAGVYHQGLLTIVQKPDIVIGKRGQGQ